MTTIRPLTFDELTPHQLRAWCELQQADSAVYSPFFRPEWVQAVAAECPGARVEVAVVEQAGEPVGFFAYQRSRWDVGYPVGGRLSDFQGLVARPGLVCSAEQLIRGCGLVAWCFDHLLASQPPFVPYHYLTQDSPWIDLSQGYAAYREARQMAGSREIPRLDRKQRKAERELGPLAFVAHTGDGRVLETLIQWKTEQYRRTGTTNVLAIDWVRSLLQRIVVEQREGFSGMLSALYVGDRLAAVHLGIRCYGVLHSWFPAYDPSLYRYSPGLLLLVQLAQAAPGLGIRRIDLGKGPEDFKRTYMSGAVRVAEGCLDVRPLAATIRRGCFDARQWLLASPLHRPARLVARTAARVVPPLHDWLKMR